MIRTLAFTLVVVSLVVPCSVYAEEVLLANGDRVSGKVQSLRSGKLAVATEWAGRVEIDFGRVASVSVTESPLLVEFVSGGRMIGQVEVGGSNVTVVAPSGGQMTVGREEILTVGSATISHPDPNLFQGWQGTTNLGFDFHRGNTDLSSLTWAFNPQRRTSTDRIRASFLSRRTVEDGDTSSDSHRGSVRYDRFFGPRFFAFGLVEAARDGREQLNLRTREGGGVGITWNTGGAQYSIFGGLTYTQEDYQNRDYVHAAEALLAFELETKLIDDVVLASKTQVLPRLSEGRYLVEFEAGIRLPLFAGISFDIQFIDNYDSRPTSAAKKNDVGILSAVGYRF